MSEEENQRVRSLSLAQLSEPVKGELRRAVDPKEALVASPDRFLLRERYTLLAVAIGLALLVVWGIVDFANACAPMHGWSNAALYALPLAPLAYLLVRYATWLSTLRVMPFKPGVYVLTQHVVMAHAHGAFTFVPLANAAGISEPRRALGGESHITLWMEGYPAVSIRVPSEGAAQCVERLEAARQAAATTGEAASFRKMRGELGDLRSSQAWEEAAAEPPKTPWVVSALGASLCALALGALTLGARDLASDHLALSNAVAARDVDALRCYVDSPGRQALDVRQSTLPQVAFGLAREEGSASTLRAFVESFPDASFAAESREAWIAAEYAEARESAWSLRAFIARFPDDRRARAGAQTLPRLSLDEARQQDLVEAYSHLIREYPDSPEAAEATALRHARYVRTQESLAARGGRPEALEFFAALFAYIEEHESPDVWVRFRMPRPDTLAAFDRVVAERHGRDQGAGTIEPIAPAFARRMSERREVLVYDRLARGFAEVVTHDVFPLAHGPRLPEPMTLAEIESRLAELEAEEREAERERIRVRDESISDHPEIRIHYEVTPTGAIYESSRATSPIDLEDLFDRDRAARRAIERQRFAGFRMDFEVEMRIPGSDERHRFEFGIEPPASILVDGGSEAPSGATVYETMVTAAFDQLGEALVGAFLGRGADADLASPVP